MCERSFRQLAKPMIRDCKPAAADSLTQPRPTCVPQSAERAARLHTGLLRRRQHQLRPESESGVDLVGPVGRVAASLRRGRRPCAVDAAGTQPGVTRRRACGATAECAPPADQRRAGGRCRGARSGAPGRE